MILVDSKIGLKKKDKYLQLWTITKASNKKKYSHLKSDFFFPIEAEHCLILFLLKFLNYKKTKYFELTQKHVGQRYFLQRVLASFHNPSLGTQTAGNNNA